MAVTLNSLGIVYSNGTSSNTAQIPSGTRMPFHQAAAPTGWTQDAGDIANNRMLRFVNDASGGGYAGSHDPTYDSTIRSHSHTLTTGTESAAHTHNDYGHAHNVNGSNANGSQFRGANDGNSSFAGATVGTSAASAAMGGSSSDHSHSGTTDDSNASATWTPRYTNLIVCSKN